MKSYVFVFSQMLKEFRRAEFEAVAQMFKISVDIASVVTSRHACIVQLPSDECVRQILSRCMLVRSATELLASGSSYAELHEDLKRNADSFKKYNSPDQSFAFKLKPIGHKRDQKYIVDRFKELDFLPLHDSPVNLSSPTNRFNLIEESDGRKPNDPPFAVHFGRFIGNGQGELKNRYNLPDRCYIGNTTMDPELSFLMANLAQAQPNSLVLDPFCGTGGILLPAAHFGGYCIGSEINYMVAHGIGKSSRVDQKYLTDEETVRKNFEQYGLEKNFLALLVADSSRHDIWQFPSSSGLFDCIVADRKWRYLIY
uniref:UPF0020 domain-containing protein n=1 Tax=Plectus sambesii TaxID=2011161 RepID=A0A914X6A6_9BILA